MKLLRLVFFALLCVGLLWYISGRRLIGDPAQQQFSINYEADLASPKKEPVRAVKSDSHLTRPQAENTQSLATESQPSPQVVHDLTEENFSTLVGTCFRGAVCELREDPWKLYESFKAIGNRRATDDLLAFLRSKLRDPAFRDRYKDVLQEMILDFYPVEERQFQEAAYFSYLGDLQRSLEIYLDLEKKAAVNPKLRRAPKLNIANVLYEQHRYKDALPYYHDALLDIESETEKTASKKDVVEFVNRRISEIERL